MNPYNSERKYKLRDLRVVLRSNDVSEQMEIMKNAEIVDGPGTGNPAFCSTSQDDDSISRESSNGPSIENEDPIFVREYPCKVSASHQKEVKALKTELHAVKSENHDLKIQIKTLKDVIQSFIQQPAQQPAEKAVHFEDVLPTVNDSWIVQELGKIATEETVQF